MGVPAVRAVAFWHQDDWHTNLPRFQGARPGHVRVEISSCCFPRGLVRFVRPRELVRFDPWHVLLQSKCIWVGRYSNIYYSPNFTLLCLLHLWRQYLQSLYYRELFINKHKSKEKEVNFESCSYSLWREVVTIFSIGHTQMAHQQKRREKENRWKSNERKEADWRQHPTLF